MTFVVAAATKTPGPTSILTQAGLVASFWLCYVMLVLSMVLERRHISLRSRPARLWAYRLALFANATMPIVLTFAFTGEYLGIDPLEWPPLTVVYYLLLPVYVAGLLFPFVSWAIVTFLCFFKDRSTKVPGRLVPAAFSILGSMAHCLLALGYAMSI